MTTFSTKETLTAPTIETSQNLTRFIRPRSILKTPNYLSEQTETENKKFESQIEGLGKFMNERIQVKTKPSRNKSATYTHKPSLKINKHLSLTEQLIQQLPIVRNK
jgi:hypothetical protein